MNIKNKIKITVNGKQMQIIPKFTLKSLITKLKMPLNKIAIELNKKMFFSTHLILIYNQAVEKLIQK